MADVAFTDIHVSSGSAAALRNFDLHVKAGETVALLGPRGSGKTTALRVLAGTLLPVRGEVRISGENIAAYRSPKRGVGAVFQESSLIATLTVAENIAQDMEELSHPPSEIARRVAHIIATMRLTAYAHSYPADLSPVQQVLVLLARALSAAPSVLVMDEPFASLDDRARSSIWEEFRRIRHELGITTIFATDDENEAATLADRVVLMAGGLIQQIGSIRQMREWPLNPFVACYFGKTNLLRGELVEIDGNGCKVRLSDEVTLVGLLRGVSELGTTVTVAIRQDAPTFGLASTGNSLRGTIIDRTDHDGTTRYTVRLGTGIDLVVTPVLPAKPHGNSARLSLANHKVMVFPA